MPRFIKKRKALQQPKYARIHPKGFIARAKNPKKVRARLKELKAQKPSIMKAMEVTTDAGVVKWSTIRNALQKVLTWKLKTQPTEKQGITSKKRIREQLVAAQKLFQFYDQKEFDYISKILQNSAYSILFGKENAIGKHYRASSFNAVGMPPSSFPRGLFLLRRHPVLLPA
jgi:hypothetical protein